MTILDWILNNIGDLREEYLHEVSKNKAPRDQFYLGKVEAMDELKTKIEALIPLIKKEGNNVGSK